MPENKESKTKAPPISADVKKPTEPAKAPSKTAPTTATAKAEVPVKVAPTTSAKDTTAPPKAPSTTVLLQAQLIKHYHSIIVDVF